MQRLMRRYKPTISLRTNTVPEDRRIPSSPSAPSHSQITGTQPPAPARHLQDAQTPLPFRRASLERERRPILPQELTTSSGTHSSMSGQPSDPLAYTGGNRTRRDSSESLSLPMFPPAVQQATGNWESASLASQTSDHQPHIQPVRDYDSSPVAHPQSSPQSIHHNRVADKPQAPSVALMHRARDPPPGIRPPQASVHRKSKSLARGRRKGWYNRRGEQLWTNKGDYKLSSPGREYPQDLANHPNHGEGWMNEEGERIDMQHRLIPMPPRAPCEMSDEDANPMHERRQGWYNRRGDQLWTNKGDYQPASPGQEYPPDLANYPDYEEGWMNEKGMRIDMQHRLMLN